MRRRPLLITGSALLVIAAIIGVLVVTLPSNATDGIDVLWNDLMEQVRQPWMLSIAHALNWVGGGWVAILLVPGIIVLVLVVMRRWRSGIFAAAAFVASAGLTQLMKQIFGRARPDDMLVASDFGSFPSGHTSNAATIAVVLWLVFPRVWVAIIGALWVVAMALSRTILSVHWITDTIGGACIGAAAALLVAVIFLRWSPLGLARHRAISAEGVSRAEDPPVP